jgi:aspartyl-tRNA(Asn)/glutamyl-tRNA(Gln) amidotransferase subunit A
MSYSGTIAGIREAIESRQTSAEAICRESLDRIERLNGALNAFLTVDAAGALDAARAIDGGSKGARGALAGVPLAVKDNICTRGLRTTAASRILEHYVPPYDATVIQRLREAGAVIVGKTNCDEFAMGSSNENSAYGAVRNPWAVDRAPGGSSGGSAAAVAARLVPMALGSDTGGSVRQPAAFCGVVGLKPTYGRVSRYGLLAFGSSLDQIGPITATVEDAARVLSVIAGADSHDATSSLEPAADYVAAVAAAADGLAGVRLGIPRRLLEGSVDEDVRRAFEAALAVFESQGAELVDVELPHTRYAIPVYYLVATAEASSNLARYDGVRYTSRAPLPADADLDAMYDSTREAGFGAEVKRRILLGTYVLSAGYYDAFYLKAQKVRTLIRQDYEEAFTRVAAVLLPTSPTPAFTIGERVADPMQMYLADVFTVSANLAGVPAVSIPCGFTRSGTLPIGLQVIGKAWDEVTVIRIAAAYERETTWHRSQPPL